jgi:hypothetical protein
VFGAVKLGGRKLTVFSIGCFLVFLLVCVIMLRAGGRDTVKIGGENYPLTVGNDEDIAAFLNACGYADAVCVTDEAITVPKNWNETYEAYQTLQLEQGFDLTPYKGKDARMLVCSIDGGADYATVLVSGDRIIAAHRGGMVQDEPMKPLIGNET